MPTKGSVRFFLFCLELELFAKIKKYLVSTHSQKPRLSITCAKFQRKILSSTIDRASQSFQFFRQITWFLGNARALPKFKYWILHHLNNIIKLLNN